MDIPQIITLDNGVLDSNLGYLATDSTSGGYPYYTENLHRARIFPSSKEAYDYVERFENSFFQGFEWKAQPVRVGRPRYEEMKVVAALDIAEVVLECMGESWPVAWPADLDGPVEDYTRAKEMV
jgi:hypothetical protein